MEIKKRISKIPALPQMSQGMGQRVIFGLIVSIILLLVLCLIAGCIIYFTNIPESYLLPAAAIISVVSLFTGGFLASRKSESRGLLTGLIIGIIFVVIMLVFSALSGTGLDQLAVKSAYCIIAAAIGGIFGVR